MFYDYHMHSNFSNDSKADMEDMIKRSIDLGLKEICFTDHVDYDLDSDDSFGIDYNKYFDKIQSLQNKYKDNNNKPTLEIPLKVINLLSFNSYKAPKLPTKMLNKAENKSKLKNIVLQVEKTKKNKRNNNKKITTIGKIKKKKKKKKIV